MNNTRPVGVLRYNAEIMRDNGAPKDVIAKYLADNGSSFEQILAVPKPNDNELARMLESEKDGTFAAGQEKLAQAQKAVETDKKIIDALGVAQGTARSFGNGLLFNMADEAESALTGQPVVDIRAEQKDFTQKHPVLSIGAGVGGALANPISRALPAAKGTVLGSQTLAKSLMGLAQGAGYGALYGFGEGDGAADRLSKAKTGAEWGGAIGGSLPWVVEGIKAAGRLGADVAGQASGAGGESLKRAYDAGTRNSETFKNAMRGKSGVYDVVDDVDNAVRSLEKARGQAFQNSLPKNKHTLLLSDKAVKEAFNKATGEISGVTAGVDDVAANALTKVDKLLTNAKYNGGLTFDNAMEIKTAIDGIIEPLSRAGEKNAIRIIKPIQNALKQTMVEAGPEYATALKEFSKSSKIIDALKGAFTSKDPTTELRKIQGITRQSVAAAQGGKQELGKLLDAVSGKKILDAVAGGQTQQLIPRDPLRAGGAVATALSTRALSANPLGVLSTLAFSPRASGEIAFALGRAASKVPQTNTNAVINLLNALQKR